MYIAKNDIHSNGCLATTEFCYFFNCAFNILNSRSKFSKIEFNKPFSLKTFEKFQDFINKFIFRLYV